MGSIVNFAQIVGEMQQLRASLVPPAIAIGILVVTVLSPPAVEEVEGMVVHAHDYPAAAVPSAHTSRGVRRTAADLFGIGRLSGDGGVRAPGPDGRPRVSARFSRTPSLC